MLPDTSRFFTVGPVGSQGRIEKMTLALFWTFGGVAIVSAVLCITRRSAVASALWLVNTFFFIAAMFLLLEAQFVAILQIIVYAGAIMVLFLFVIMLLNLGHAGPSDMKGTGGKVVAGLLFLGLLVELWALRTASISAELRATGVDLARMTEERGAVGVIAGPLFRTYLVPFEITSVLLLAAVAGAVILAKRKI